MTRGLMQGMRPRRRASVVLRPFRAHDVERLIAWVEDEAALFDWAGGELVYPLGPNQLPVYPRDRSEAGGLLPFAVLRSAVNLDAVGHVALADLDPRHRSVRLSRVLVGHPMDRRRGIGRAIVCGALARAFDVLGVNRVWCYVPRGNLAATRCLEAAGFAREGLLRECAVQSGAFVDCYTMALLRRDWASTRRAPERNPHRVPDEHKAAAHLLPSESYVRMNARGW